MGVCNTLAPPPRLLRKANKPSLVKHRVRNLIDKGSSKLPYTTAIEGQVSSSFSPPHRPRRSVRIGEVRVIPVDKHLTDDKDEHEKARIWWTKEEKREIIDRNHLLANDFRLHHPSHVQRANAVYDHICAEDVSASDGGGGYYCSDSSSDEEDGESQQQSLEEELVGEITSKAMIDLPTHLRGLEWGILPASKSHRRTHVRTVLQWQETLSRSTFENDDNDDDKMTLLLGQHAMASSRRSRLLARILAESDAAPSTNPSALDDRGNNKLRRVRPRMIPSWW